MQAEVEALNRLLRCEMTAVHQQFIHVLALRDWGHAATAGRVMEVDRVDFPNAMRMIEHLVRRKAPVTLEGDEFAPGRTHREVLVSELEVERRLTEALTRGDPADETQRALFETAARPRQEYLRWLESQLDAINGDSEALPDYPGETAILFGCLLTVIEQSMAHAFVHHHAGRADLADAAWASSGAAMMQATDLVHHYAARRTAPCPRGMPSPRIEYETTDALHTDAALARRCAAEAAAAVDCGDAETTGLCRPIADYYERLTGFAPGAEHPAAVSNPPAFRSFQATLDKFL